MPGRREMEEREICMCVKGLNCLCLALWLQVLFLILILLNPHGVHTHKSLARCKASLA